ncbi:Uroporphyrinogen III synthase HEM4 [Catenulispora acidiphila DSM 44928]|uniref:uroporphyrinogen-III C-methyltransferase n=2 Tax=Catenulispora TaxID=414878 RepID=C7QKP8_CATAD|nr:Uroporphyrinogen III synthase HEM4 [Catenulispora acidiphila DSM 44928]
MTEMVKVLEVLEGAGGVRGVSAQDDKTDGGGEAGMVTTTQRGSASALDSCATTALLAFVGAGPGDPELLTLRAVALLAGADVIAAEAGLLERLSTHLNPDATLVPVVENERGELGELGDATVSLTPASRMKNLLSEVAAGRRVVRLTSGDPGLSGVVAAEAALCAKAGVVYEIVPGVAVSTAVPLYAGISLGRSSGQGGVRIRSLADVADSAGKPGAGPLGTHETLVMVGPAHLLEAAAAALQATGLAKATTPVAVTADGSMTTQRTVASTLARVAIEASALIAAGGEVVVVVGAAVADRAALSWYETKPLFGWKVLVPRTKEQAEGLSHRLRTYGAVSHEVPTIAVEPPRTPQQMERAVKGLVTGRYEWVAFTSQNAVKAIREKFEEYGLDARAFAGIKVAAVGEQTAAALVAFGVQPDLVPSGEQSAAGLLEDFPAYDPVFDPIERVFLPRADIATDTLIAGLIELGWEVDDVTAYRTVRAAPPPAEVREAIKGGGFDAVLFTSSSTVRNLVGIAGKPHAATVIACIGPQTAKTAEEHGLRVDVMAPSASVTALADALAAFGESRRLSALSAGEPLYRPSERRPGGRRRSAR